MRPRFISWIVTLLIFLIAAAANAQTGGAPASPYHVSFKRDVFYGGAAVGSVAFGSLLRSRTPDIVLADLQLGNIPPFDRIATEFSSSTARNLSDYALYASAALPGLLIIGKESRQEAAKISLLFIETMLFNQGLTDIIKSSAKRPRPYVFDENLNPTTVIKGNDRAAFLSGHTSTSAAGGFFFARVFSDYYPDSRLKPYAWILGAGFPALTGYLRIRAGQHYPSDVLAGYVLGAMIGYIVPTLHRKPPATRRISLAPMGSGFYLSYRF